MAQPSGLSFSLHRDLQRFGNLENGVQKHSTMGDTLRERECDKKDRQETRGKVHHVDTY